MSAEHIDFADRDAERALCEHYGGYKLERTICDGQKGYGVTHPNGVRCFHYRLNTAIREMLKGLGHGDDREVIVIGEPEVGNA
jgi:hypothetical protein